MARATTSFPVPVSPRMSIAILEQDANEYSAEAGGIAWIVNKNFEVVAVKSIKPILRPKPHKAQIVLNKLASLYLGQLIRHRRPSEPKVRSVYHGQDYWSRINARLQYCVRLGPFLGSRHTRNQAEKSAKGQEGRDHSSKADLCQSAA